MKKTVLGLAAMAMAASSAMAQVNIKTDAGDLKLRLIGRMNLDYGRYIIHSEDPTYGVQANDTRLGFVASFDDKWSAKSEIRFDNKSISFRDLWVGYSLNNTMSLKAGNHFQPFGAKILGLQYKFIEDATADYAICPNRKIGVSYDYTTNIFKATAGLYSDADIDNLGGTNDENQGYSVSGKVIFRPLLDETTVLHFGAAGMYTDISANATPFTANQPETFNEKNIFKFNPNVATTVNINRGEGEFIFIKKRFYMEAHYLHAFVNSMGDIKNYKLNGAYAQTSFLLIGKQQNYNKKTGLAANASPKNLELLARVSYFKGEIPSVDEDKEETVFISDQNIMDFTVGLNYFFNKYVNARLNYTVSQLTTEADSGDDITQTNNAIQARLQFAF